MTRAAVYCRISEDPTGNADGVERQLEDCLRLVEARADWQLVGQYIDNDVSALRGKRRERYQALMSAAEAGEVDVIVCWMQSRLWRNRKERAEAIEALAEARIRIVAVRGSDLDMTTAQGRLVAGLVGEFDTHESEVKSERVARAAQQRAEQGKPNGGIRGFGFTAKNKTIIPEEAEIIRQAARWLLDDGLNVSQIATRLDEQGVKPPKAAKWTRLSVRRMLTSPSVAGRRYHQGRDVGPARWGAILDEATWAAVKDRLATNRQADGWSNNGKYLLAGLARCGKCGAKVWSHTSTNGRTKKRYLDYSCLPKTSGGCRGVSRSIARVDPYVESVIVGRLGFDDVRSKLISVEAPDASEIFKVERDVSSVRQRLVDIAEEFADATDDIGKAQFRAADRRLRAQLDELLARQARLARQLAFGDLVGIENLATHWETLTLSRKRDIVRAMADVVIHPAGRSPRFNPDLIEFRWK